MIWASSPCASWLQARHREREPAHRGKADAFERHPVHLSQLHKRLNIQSVVPFFCCWEVAITQPKQRALWGQIQIRCLLRLLPPEAREKVFVACGVSRATEHECCTEAPHCLSEVRWHRKENFPSVSFPLFRFWTIHSMPLYLKRDPLSIVCILHTLASWLSDLGIIALCFVASSPTS